MSADTFENTDRNSSEENIDSRIIPVMREAVALVQLVLFGELKKSIKQRFQDWQDRDQKWLVGAVVNNLFGSSVSDSEITAFAKNNRELIEDELRGLAERFPDLLPYLTDALRMQTLCDEQEGVNSLPTLLMARALGILKEERALPMPSTFMIFVRKLGAQHRVLETMHHADQYEGD